MDTPQPDEEEAQQAAPSPEPIEPDQGYEALAAQLLKTADDAPEPASELLPPPSKRESEPVNATAQPGTDAELSTGLDLSTTRETTSGQATEPETANLSLGAYEPSESMTAEAEPPGSGEINGIQEDGLEPIPEPETSDAIGKSDQPLVEVHELASAHMLPWSDEPPGLEAFELGTVLNGRYQIIEVIDAEPTQVRYRVRDLERCPRCGATGHSAGEAFCAECGALMDQKPVALMVQQPSTIDHAPESIEPEDQFTEGEQNYWVWREDVPEKAKEQKSPLMRLLVGLQSDTGQVRELDEDSMFVLTMAYTFESVTHQLGLFVVADGMGGHEGGEVASQLAIQTAAQALLRDVFGPELAGSELSTDVILDCIENAIRKANDEVYLKRQKRENDMGTTLTVILVKDWILHLGHVGDCRAYRWGQEGLQQLTTDHSIVAGMAAAGTISPEEIYTHPQRSVIYRCVGDEPTVEVDVGSMQLDQGERLLVCCDGLWEMLRNEGIDEILLAEADPQTACDLMVYQANLAGGTDNISVIIVQL